MEHANVCFGVAPLDEKHPVVPLVTAASDPPEPIDRLFEHRLELEKIHSFLVHPAKKATDPPPIGGATVPPKGKLGKMLTEVFERASAECDIDIVFLHDADGKQNNPCRDLLVAYIADPTVTAGREVAKRLQEITTLRSGLGLLFLMKGTEAKRQRLVLSRFPADQGVVAQANAQQLTVEFIEQVFMKSAKAYKSALYSSEPVKGGFWEGRAVDRQLSGPRELSDYWIRDFLMSELRTTGPAGTMRLAVGIRDAIRSTASLQVRQELIAAVTLLRGQDKKRSVRKIVQDLALSPEAVGAIEAKFPRPELMDETFQFDKDEFDKHVPYRAVELDNGGMMVAEDSEFPKIFRREQLDGPGQVRFVTEGRIVDERLRKSK